MEEVDSKCDKRVSIDPNIEILRDNGFVVIQADDIESRNESETLAALKDTRRCWYVCFAAFLIQVIDVGVLHVFGVFFIAMIEEFRCSKADAAWIGSMAYGFTMLFAPVASILIRRFGSGKVAASGSVICSVALVISSFMPSIGGLYGSFGFLYGLGTCLAYTPTMTIAGDYFEKHLTTATGLMVAGSSTGTLILSPLTQALIANIGWRNTFRAYSVMVLAGIWSGWMFKPLVPRTQPRSPSKVIKKSMARKLMAEVQLWKNRVFLVWISAITCTMFGYYVPYVHLVAHAQDLGIHADKGAILLMLLGGTTAIGRILFGRIVALRILNRLHMHQLSMVVTGMMCMLLPLIKPFYGLILYVIIIGLVDGCYVVLLPVLTASLFGAENKVTAWGFLTACGSITFTLGPPIAGWLYDASGSYDVAFHVAGVPIIMGAVILLFVPWAQRTSTTTNVMTAARESYAIMGAEEEGDVREVDDGIPLDIFNISASKESIHSDQEVLRMSSDSSDGQQQQQHKPVIIVDVTEVVQRKVSEALEEYRNQSVDIQRIHDSSLTNIASPVLMVGSKDHRSARFVVGSPLDASLGKSPITVCVSTRNSLEVPGLGPRIITIRDRRGSVSGVRYGSPMVHHPVCGSQTAFNPPSHSHFGCDTNSYQEHPVQMTESAKEQLQQAEGLMFAEDHRLSGPRMISPPDPGSQPSSYRHNQYPFSRTPSPLPPPAVQHTTPPPDEDDFVHIDNHEEDRSMGPSSATTSPRDDTPTPTPADGDTPIFHMSDISLHDTSGTSGGDSLRK